jgi:hypothetical protein
MEFSSMRRRASIAIIALLFVCTCELPCAQAQLSTSGAVQISIGTGDPQTPPDDWSKEPVAPPNGDFIVFTSRATNLSSLFSPGTSAVAPNIYQYSPLTGITLISQNTLGFAPKGPLSFGSFAPAVSSVLADGSYAIAFASDAEDLVESYSSSLSGSSNHPQIYVRLSATNTTYLVSKAAATTGNVGGNYESLQPAIQLVKQNPPTYRVCFSSRASNLITSLKDAGWPLAIYCKELTVSNGLVTEGEMMSMRELPPDGDLEHPAFSGDGKFLAFSSSATIIAGKPTNSYKQIYMFSFADSQAVLVSKTASGELVQGHSSRPTLSYSGSIVSFLHTPPGEAGGSTLPGFETITSTAFVLFTKSSGVFSRINSDSSGNPSSGAASAGKIDSTGQYALFTDSGENIPAPGANPSGLKQVYLKDLTSSQILPVSVTSAGVAGDANSGSNLSMFSESPIALGRAGYNSPKFFAGFTSFASNLASVGTPFEPEDQSFLFRSPISTTPPTLTRNFIIETPPDAVVVRRTPKGKSDLLLTFLKVQADPSLFAKSTLTILAAKGRVSYEYDLKKTGAKFRVKRIASRNTTTIRKLSPGRYTLRYRIIATKGKKTVRSRFSPTRDIVLS